MGSAISRIRFITQIVLAISATYDKVAKRLAHSPGIPLKDPCTPYWTIPPSPIAKHGSDTDIEVPRYADVVIIGSGITGTAIARTLLDEYAEEHGSSPLRVVMLEARDACSGATARNGGHITPLLYHDYSKLKSQLGMAAAKTIIRFRLAHLTELLNVAREEDLLEDSQVRKVESYDVFFQKSFHDDMKKRLEAYLADIPEENCEWSILEDSESIEEIQLTDKAVGVISTTAGSIHPYRLVTGILSRLLDSYPKTFSLFTHTPCTSISSNPSSKDVGSLYAVHTPKGTIYTPHVVHATNAWASHLLVPMRGKIVPVRGSMTAQRPGLGLGALPNLYGQSGTAKRDNKTWLGGRNFIFYPGADDEKFDYLTQQPPRSEKTSSSHYPSPSGELMFGGGLWQGSLADRAISEELGNLDDREWNLRIGAYLAGALQVYFGKWWGAEGRDDDTLSGDSGVAAGRIKKHWSGIIGISADRMPWVGRLPEKVSGRQAPAFDRDSFSTRPDPTDAWRASSDTVGEKDMDYTYRGAHDLAPSGEWIAAGFTGEGMTHAWMSGKGLAYMLLGMDDQARRRHRWPHKKSKGAQVGIDCCRETILSVFCGEKLSDWFPQAFRVTEKRWKKASLENF